MHPPTWDGIVGDAKQKKGYTHKIANQEIRIVALKKLLSYYKEITETVREPFIILDSSLHVVTANRAFYKMFKVLKKDTEGKLIYKLGNNQWESPELRVLLERILPAKRILHNYQVTHEFPGLGSKTMMLNARQVDSKQLILLAIEDITIKMGLKVAANELTANLISQRNRLQSLNDAKEEFIALASHQLRTPATAVKQYVGMLTNDYAGKLTKEQARMLNIAYESNQQQLEIIDDLLRVARVDAGKVYLQKASCDLTQEMITAVHDQAVLFKVRQQTVKLTMPKQKILVHADKKLMRMVLENILDNAGKYSGQGQKITISLKQDITHAAISIKDHGVGIRKVDQRKLFQKFSRIDNPNSVAVVGTGLGLYWAKKIIDLHDGTIEVDSKLNHGTTFTVKIPII